MEAKVVIALQRRVFLPGSIDARDQSRETIRTVQVPAPEFVFLSMKILFRSCLSWPVLTKLKGGPVNAVIRAERCGQDQAAHEGRPSAELQVLREDIRCVGPQIRTKVLPHLCFCELGEVACDLRLGIAPSEVRV